MAGVSVRGRAASLGSTQGADLVGVGFILLTSLLLRQPLRAAPGEGWRLALLGVAGYAVEAAFFFAGLKHGTAAAATLLFFTYPVAVALIAFFLGKGLPGWLLGGALVAAVGGAAVVAVAGGGVDIDGTGAARTGIVGDLRHLSGRRRRRLEANEFARRSDVGRRCGGLGPGYLRGGDRGRGCPQRVAPVGARTGHGSVHGRRLRHALRRASAAGTGAHRDPLRLRAAHRGRPRRHLPG